MFNTLIYGAGSIGNHLGYACRNKDWEVTIYDNDPEALGRTREDIYPSRYGRWDSKIELVDQLDRRRQWDLVIIGTPPDSHLPLCMDLLDHCTPRIILIEKPMCTPDLNGCRDFINRARDKGVITLVGYNHNLTQNTIRACQLLSDGLLGEPRSMSVRWVEHWGGIFQAHPWLDGPADSYLGFLSRGGGACAEHSHAISLYLYFCRLLGLGAVSEVSAAMDICKAGEVEYDRSTFITLRTDRDFVGTIAMDVVTEPPQKVLRIQGSDGFLEWHANYEDGHDAVIYNTKDSGVVVEKIAKTRPDDFAGEVDHVEALLKSGSDDSPIALEHGVEAMMIVAASHLSNRDRRVVRINTSRISNTLDELTCLWKKEGG